MKRSKLKLKETEMTMCVGASALHIVLGFIFSIGIFVDKVVNGVIRKQDRIAHKLLCLSIRSFRLRRVGTMRSNQVTPDRVLSEYAGHAGSDSRELKVHVIGIFILFPAFFVLANVRNNFGIVFASALFALSAVLTPTSTSIEKKLKRILEHFTAKTNSAQVDTKIKMQPKKPSKRGYVYRYILHFVTYIALWEVVLRVIGWC